MAKKKKHGTYIHGIAASEHLDSSGERILIEGIDISSLTKDGVFNFEHQSKEASSIVGKILLAKKIFRKADCESDAQRYFWDKIKMPFLYVAGELFDAVGHQAAKDVAAMLKYDEHVDEDTKKLINFSIEGARLDKRGSEITKCIARKISITITPCNKVCEAAELAAEDLKKIGSVSSEGGLFSAIENLVDKSEAHFPSCHIMKQEHKTGFVPVKKPTSGTNGKIHSKGEEGKIKKTKKSGEKVEKMFVPTDANTFGQGVGKTEDLEKAHIGEEVQQRIRQKQRPKRMARKPVRRVRPSKTPVGPKQNRMARLGMYDSNMRKAITAGGMGGAPGAAVQGEALRKEHREKTIENVVDKSEALRIISDDAFNNFDKKQELVDFLTARLVGLNKNEILALAKTIAYNYQKSNEVKLMKILEKNVYNIKTGKKLKPTPKKQVKEKTKNDPLKDLKGNLKRLNQLHDRLRDMRSKLENET